MNKTKKITSLVLAVMMVVSMLVVGTVAASAATTVSTVAELESAMATGGEINIANDLAVNKVLHVVADTTINATGKTIKGAIFVYYTNTAVLTFNGGTYDGNNKDNFICTPAQAVPDDYQGTEGQYQNDNAGTIINLNGVTVQNYKGSNGYVGAVNLFSHATGNFTDCVFTNNGSALTGNSRGKSGADIWAGAATTVNITNSTFADSVFLNADNAGATATIKNSSVADVILEDTYAGTDGAHVAIIDSAVGVEIMHSNTDAITCDNGSSVVTTDVNGQAVPAKTQNLITNETQFAYAVAAGGNWIVGDNFTIEATADGTYTVGDKELTLNLGGKTITTNPYVIANNGKLTITGEGTITAIKGVIDNYGELVVLGGTLTNTDNNNVIWNNAGASVVVDGGTIVPAASTAGITNVGGDVTVNSGSIESASEGSIGVVNSNANSTLTVNGGTVKATDYGVYNYGTTTVNGGTIEGKTGIGTKGTVTVNGGAINGVNDGWGIVTWADSTTTVNDGTITGGYGISGNGNETGYTINVTGGTITGDDLGIYNPGYGYVNISGGTIEGATAVYSKSGETNISGGTLRAVMVPGKSYDYYGNGGKPTGDAVVIDNCNYPGGTPSVSITGGNFETTDGSKDAVHSYVQSDDEDLPTTVTNPTTDDVRITGFIEGGTFSSNVTSLCVDGLAAESTGGVFTIVPFEINGKADIQGYQDKIQKTEQSSANTGNDINTKGVRIVTKVDRDWLDAAAEDYGYLVGKVTDGQKTFKQDNCDFTRLNTNNGAKKISCAGTNNEGVGYDNNYITLAVNGMTFGDKVVARFYVVVNGVTYFANYINDEPATYTGILADFKDTQIL